jgi:hypothetical protein
MEGRRDRRHEGWGFGGDVDLADTRFDFSLLFYCSGAFYLAIVYNIE